MSEPTHPGERELQEGEEQAPSGARAMAVVRWAIVALMAIVAAASILYYFDRMPRAGSAAKARYYCPMHPNIVQDLPGDCPICGMSLVPATAGAPTAAAPAPPKHDKPSYSCPMHSQIAEEKPGDCPICGMKLVPAKPGAEKPAANPKHAGDGKPLYVCPMHPAETSTDPAARCSICKMRLEPRSASKEDQVPGVVPVDIAPDRVQLIGMRTAKALRQSLTGELRTVGYVSASEKGIATITTRFAGWIEKLHVNQTGEHVARGQVLATVYSPQLLQAQQELLAARRWRGGATAQADASGAGLEADAARRLELLGISREEIADVLRSGQPLRALRIRASVSGHVTQKNVFAGAYVQPGTTLFELADLSSVWVLAAVYEHEIGRVRIGQNARLDVPAYPGEGFTGKVQFIYPTLDAATRTLRVRIVLPNRALKLKPGMYGTARLELDRAEGVVVPREAVVDTGEVQYVFIALEGGRFRPRKVTLGARVDDKVQIVSGLAEGETVVTTGNFLVDSESRLRAAIHGMAGGAHDARAK